MLFPPMAAGFPATRRPAFWVILATALSLSLGWGIRGNFGHESGAMIPGALATMMAVLLSGREDWWPRVAWFGMFGALGWSFGGSISYMQVIAYTHSGHSMSVLYGFACLFLIGFLWGAIGGTGSALPACLDTRALAGFVPVLTSIFAAWWLQDTAVSLVESPDGTFRQASPLYWYDTDWLGVLVAIGAVLLLGIIRRRWDDASSLVLHMAIGWWLGFLLLVVILGWRMTPPRGDNWAGCLGMVGGLWLFLQRRGWQQVTTASVLTGFVGGFGFATATALKLIEVKSGLQTNWHSILEQTYGLINGIGLGVATLLLAERAPRQPDDRAVSPSRRLYPIAFLLLLVSYLNLRKNPSAWIRAKAMGELLYGWSPEAWFNLGFALLAATVTLLFWFQQRHRLAIVPPNPLGRGQLLYLAFLWLLVVGNFERALVSFGPERLVTEGVIFVNALVGTLLVLVLPERLAAGLGSGTTGWQRPAVPMGRVAAVGLVASILSVTADWGVVRALYGDHFAGHAARHIRFGPDSTASRAKPSEDQPHP
ncbi:MAG: hypothetical protein U1G07_20535 [Verrucomicrobiota bacterium]